MSTWRHLFHAALPITACLLILCGCRATERIPAPDRVGSFDGLSKLYRTSTTPHRRAFRRPIRDERAGAMRLLAAKAGHMADDSLMLPLTPAVTDAGPTISAKENDAVAGFRDSLRSLEAAARRGSISTVRASYRHAAHHNRLLNDISATPTTNR
jgi:hypothetical protein